VPPPRRRPATPAARRPKVAGQNRRSDVPEEAPAVSELLDLAEPIVEEPVAEEQVAEDPVLDGPVIGEPANGQVKPAQKRRDNGTVASPRPRHRLRDPEPVLVEPAADDDEEPLLDPEPESPNLWLPIALVVVALLVAGLGYWFSVKAADARVGSGNTSQVDVNGTKDLVGAAQQAVAGVLSYKFDEMDKSTAQAKQYLSGEAVSQYDKSMQALAAEIQKQQLQVAVNPVKVGVVRMNGDDARVLIFADQIGVRADKQPSGGPTQFAMDMHRTDGKWKIVKLDFFDGK
jgi:Mce-associated membrane protein